MKLTLWNTGKALNRWKNKVLGIMIAYTSGVVINLITEADSMMDWLKICVSINRPAILLMWLLIFFTILIYVFSAIISSINKKQSPSAAFEKIMKLHTASELNAFGRNELSWGYNKNIHRAKEPLGWSPDSFYIASYQDNHEYEFPVKNNELPDYTRQQYNAFLDTAFAHECIAKGNNQMRFAAIQVEPNFNNNNRKVAIHLLKTHWLPLQFSWNYFRLLDQSNEPIIDKLQKSYIRKAIGQVFLDTDKPLPFYINSFCLHLILETTDGKAILARISGNKKNDYPSTWAATLGEQLDKDDFYDSTNNSTYPDFIWRWTKRALYEELRIDDKKGEDGVSELEEYMDKNSLRILSVDYEGDIYNIALTCVMRLNVDFDYFRANKSIWIDREEATEFIACDLKEIRDILLHYPSNIHEYHPSTYLRLLMFHLYRTGTKELCRAISEDYKSLKNG